jgi:multidrug transporter EmrE-like cation transporter
VVAIMVGVAVVATVIVRVFIFGEPASAVYFTAGKVFYYYGLLLAIANN